MLSNRHSATHCCCPFPPNTGSWKPPLLRWVSSAGREKCFSLGHSSLPQGAWLPRAQTLQWARPSLDHMPSLDDVYASFSSPCGTPGKNRCFQMQSWWAQRGDGVTAFRRVGIIFYCFLPSFSLVFPRPLSLLLFLMGSKSERAFGNRPGFILPGSLTSCVGSGKSPYLSEPLNRNNLWTHSQPNRNATAST